MQDNTTNNVNNNDDNHNNNYTSKNNNNSTICQHNELNYLNNPNFIVKSTHNVQSISYSE